MSDYRIPASRLDEIEAFPPHDEHGERGFVTMRRDELVNLVRDAREGRERERRFYLPDGTFVDLDPREVIRRRIVAASDLNVARGKALAYDLISRRDDEARELAAAAASENGNYLGWCNWHIVLDQALKLRAARNPSQQLERLPDKVACSHETIAVIANDGTLWCGEPTRRGTHNALRYSWTRLPDLPQPTRDPDLKF